MMPKPTSAISSRTLDPDLVDGLRRGDPAALTALYQAMGPELMSLALRLSGSVADAEDSLHDLIVGLPEALRSYNERGAFRAWLKKVVVRMTLMRLRAAKRRNETPLDAVAPPAVQPPAQTDVADAIERGMRELSPGVRAVVVLRLFENLSHQEIANVLRISVSASETRLSRGLAALRQRLEGLV